MSATRTVTVAVTAEDIAAGEPCLPCSCPVARAITRHLVDGLVAFVTGITVYIDTPNFETRAKGHLARIAEESIQTYDDGGAMVPFTFTLDLPVEVLP